jgi:hypothetical protein
VLDAARTEPKQGIGQIGVGDFVNLNPAVPIILMALTYWRSRAGKPSPEGAKLTFEQPLPVRISQPVGR